MRRTDWRNTNYGGRNQRNEIRGAKQRRICSFIPNDSHLFHGHYRIPLCPWSVPWCRHRTLPHRSASHHHPLLLLLSSCSLFRHGECGKPCIHDVTATTAPPPPPPIDFFFVMLLMRSPLSSLPPSLPLPPGLFLIMKSVTPPKIN